MYEGAVDACVDTCMGFLRKGGEGGEGVERISVFVLVCCVSVGDSVYVVLVSVTVSVSVSFLVSTSVSVLLWSKAGKERIGSSKERRWRRRRRRKRRRGMRCESFNQGQKYADEASSPFSHYGRGGRG